MPAPDQAATAVPGTTGWHYSLTSRFTLPFDDEGSSPTPYGQGGGRRDRPARTAEPHPHVKHGGAV